MMRTLRWALWALVAIAVAAFAYLSLAPRKPEPAVQSGIVSIASIGGPFTLTGTDGKPFASASLAGKPYVLFFGFTHCPDVCPTTLARLAKLRTAVGKGDAAFPILFVTVDPERDTPAEMANYAELFATPIVALTGSTAQVDEVRKLFGVYAAKAPQSGGGYSVDHTATIFLMGRDGKMAATIAPDESDNVALMKLRSLVG